MTIVKTKTFDDIKITVHEFHGHTCIEFYRESPFLNGIVGNPHEIEPRAEYIEALKQNIQAWNYVERNRYLISKPLLHTVMTFPGVAELKVFHFTDGMNTAIIRFDQSITENYYTLSSEPESYFPPSVPKADGEKAYRSFENDVMGKLRKLLTSHAYSKARSLLLENHCLLQLYP